MKLSLTLFSALLFLAAALPSPAEDELSEEDKALFDDIQVTKEEETKARERLDKTEAPAQPQSSLPEGVSRVLDRLAVYEASLDGITDEAIVVARKAVGAQMISLSNITPEPAKTALIVSAKNIEGLKPDIELPLAGTGDELPGEWIYEKRKGRDSRWFYRDGSIKTNWSKGSWHWLNSSNRIAIVDYASRDYVDVMRLIVKPGKPPTIEAFNLNDHWTLAKGQTEEGDAPPPMESSRILTAARANEAKVRTNTLKQTREKRERVAVWLVAKAKTSEPETAKLMLARAAALRATGTQAAPAKVLREADTFRGKVFLDNKQRTWEFLPDGTVKSKGSSWGSWDWAKASGNSCLVLYSGAPQKAETAFLVNLSEFSSGKLHFNSFTESFDAKVK
ncbi:MAG TPA: hypothetical protein VHM91_09270 [Verrucomicrobiales bacterium]|nr:hypothetical protein [Verrucomicrobiales bacterium]